MNTAIRLFILIPAAMICLIIAVISVGFGGLNVESITFAIVVAVSPLALVAWSIADHRKRHRDDS